MTEMALFFVTSFVLRRSVRFRGGGIRKGNKYCLGPSLVAITSSTVLAKYQNASTSFYFPEAADADLNRRSTGFDSSAICAGCNEVLRQARGSWNLPGNN